MTKEESMPDFEHLLQAPNSAETPATQAASPRSAPSRKKNRANTKKGSPSGFSTDATRHEHNGVLEEDEKIASIKTTPNHLLENGSCEDTSADTKNANASDSYMDITNNDNGKIAPAKMGSSHKRKSKPVKLQKTRRKSIVRQPGNVPQPRPNPAPESLVNACSTSVSLATTDTIIQSIPDLFKNASIGTENFLPMVNGPTVFENDIPADVEPSDIVSQICSSVLPPFTPPLPPERFEMPAPDQHHCCLDCGDQFWVETSLTQHLQRRSIYITFNCATCKKLLVFYNRCTLLGHVRVHHDRSQPADIQQASISPLPHELIQCIQDQKPAESSAGSTPVVTIIMPPNSDDILTVTKPNQKQVSKCKCPECHYQCGSFASLQEHLGCGQSSPGECGAQCPQCNMVCPSRCSLLCHQRIHVQSKPYLCPECGQNPAEKWDDFQRHLAIECMHYSRTIGFQCPACSLLVVTPEQLRHHVIGTHSEFYYKCPACPMAFRAEAAFDAHRKSVHVMDNLNCATIRKCPLCEVVFQSSDVLQNHLENHFHEVLKASKFLFMCLECNQLFEDKVQLGQHLQTSHGSLFDKGATEVAAKKRRINHPRKRAHPASKSNAASTKTSPAVIAKPAAKDVELVPDKALKPKGSKSKILKPKLESSGDPVTDEPMRREPRIPPLVLSLKDHVPNSSPVIKKRRVNRDSSGMYVCEDCGRAFTTEIGCRVHRQRSHVATYKLKKQFRLTLDRRSRRSVPETTSTDNESSKPVEEVVAQRPEDDFTESKPRLVKRRSSSSAVTTCVKCGRNFHSSQGCSVHRQRCQGNQDNVKSKCAVCQEFYPDPHAMAEHGQMHLKEGTLVCTLCNNLVFNTKLALSKHIENHAHNTEYPASCVLCAEELAGVDPAIEHWRKEHGLMCFHCPKCDAQYLYKKSLNRHIQAQHATPKNMEEEHSTPRELQEIATKTDISDVSENLVTVKLEPLSPEPSQAVDEQDPESEKSNEIDSEEYLCAKCNFKASDRPSFQSHITVHKTESDSYQCLECGTSFVVEPSLRKHLTCTHKVKDLETFMLERGYADGSLANNNEVNDNGTVSVSSSSNGGHNNDGGKTNPLECTVCFLSLENELALKIHSRTHGMAFIRSKRNARVNSQSSDPADTPNTTPTSTPTKNDV